MKRYHPHTIIIIVLLLFLSSCGDTSSHNNDRDTINDFDTVEEEVNDSDSDRNNDTSHDSITDGDSDSSTPPSPISLTSYKGDWSDSFDPSYFTETSNNITVFNAKRIYEGEELWSSDGTPKGTHLVKDIFPGDIGSNPRGFIALDKKVFFVADTPTQQGVLYRTDGSTAGTQPVLTDSKEFISPYRFAPMYRYSSELSSSIVTDNHLFFFILRNEKIVLFSVDTENNVEEIATLSSSYAVFAGQSHNALFFIDTTDDGVWMLWKYDVKEKKTTAIYDFEYRGESISISKRHQFFDTFVFMLKREKEDDETTFVQNLFISDGTPEGTIITLEDIWLEDIQSASNGIYILTARKGIYFTRAQGDAAIHIDLKTSKSVISLGVANDTTLVVILVDEGETTLNLFDLITSTLSLLRRYNTEPDVVVKPPLFFYKDSWYTTDGTTDDRFYYSYLQRIDCDKKKLMKIDTPINVSNLTYRTAPMEIAIASNRIWISADVRDGGQNTGYEIIISDGSDIGTFLLGDQNHAGYLFDTYFYPLFSDDMLYFNLENHIVSYNPFTKSKEVIGEGEYKLTSSHSLPYQKRLFFAIQEQPDYFNASFGIFNKEDNILEPFLEGRVTNMILLHGGILFFAYNESNRSDLYHTEGTINRTTLLKEANKNVSSSLHNTTLLSDGNRAIFFDLAGDNTNGYTRQIWATDGTVENTTLLLGDIHSYYYLAYENFMCGKNFILSSVTTDIFQNLQYEAYISQGTPETTKRIITCDNENNCKHIHLACVAEQAYLIKQNFDEDFVSLHKIADDGIFSKAFLEIPHTFLPKTSSSLSDSKSEFFFFSLADSHGLEAWKSDGTATGTVLIKDILPGKESSNPLFHHFQKPFVYFSASDGTHGYELWKSDGSKENTELVADINLGTASLSPREVMFHDSFLTVTGGGEDGFMHLWLMPIRE